MKIQAVKVEDAVGCILSHDLTQVVRGSLREAPLKKVILSQKKTFPSS